MRFVLPLVCFVSFTLSVHATPYAGPAADVKISDARSLVDFAKDVPGPEATREFRLVLRDAITLTDIEKQGIKGGGGVREVAVTTYGNIILLIPVVDGKPNYEASSGEVSYLGVNRIGYRGPLKVDPADPLTIRDGVMQGSVLFPVEIREPKQERPRVFSLSIRLDLTVKTETFGHTPDPDASIPPWRSDKTQPSGFKVVGTWKTIETKADRRLELEGKIAGARGCFRLRPTPGKFFPVQAIDLALGKGGLALKAHASPVRVDSHDSQWAVRELDAPVDLRSFNGLRLKVFSEGPATGKPIPAGVAVAFRVKGQPWYACRTVAPLLGGEQTYVVDFEFFERGTANPGFRGGPNIKNFADLSQVDAIAVGVSNPYGVGEVAFTALELDAVKYGSRGHGEPPTEVVDISVNPSIRDRLNGVDTVPKALFGYHLANTSFQSNEAAPSWFDAPPISGDGMKVLELAKPGSLRPIDHTNFSAETGASMVRPIPADIAKKADAMDDIMHSITNENLWARPKWMDVDLEGYTEGIRGMFRQVGTAAWTPDKPDNTLRRIEFWNEPFMWARHINRGQSTLSAGPGDPGGNRGRKAWDDPTQFNFMPGKLGGEIYAKFFNAAAEGLQETNPHVQIGGMSSGSFGEDSFSQLTNYVSHFLAASSEQIDFLTEHHYSGFAPSFAAGYEVATAWSDVKHGKRWPIWNTEANDLDDVAPGDRRSAEAAKAFTDLNRAYYNYRDILEMIVKSRDKAAGRAIHALWGRGWFKNEGEQLMYLHTAALRGTLVLSDSSDAAILPVATVNNGKLVVYLLNDSPFPREARVKLTGLKTEADPEVSGLRLAPDESVTSVFPAAFQLEQTGGDTILKLKEPLAPREITKITLQGVPEPKQTRETTQFFSDVLIADVLPGKPVTGRVKLDPKSLVSAKGAILRVVSRDVQTGEAELKIGSAKIPLPASTAEGSHHQIQEVPVDLEIVRKAMRPDGTLEMETQCIQGRDGFTLYNVSLLVNSEP